MNIICTILLATSTGTATAIVVDTSNCYINEQKEMICQ